MPEGIDHLASAEIDGGAFGDLVYEVDCGGSWGHSVAWSPSGSFLAVTTHSSSIIVAQGFSADGAIVPAAAHPAVVSLRCLPLKSVLFLTDE